MSTPASFNTSVNQFIRNIKKLRDELNSTVVVVHHSGKQANNSERGSSALRGAMDTMMQSTSKGTGGSGYFVLTCEKQKDADQFEPLFFVLKQVQLDENQTSAVIVESDIKSTANLSSLSALNENEKLVLKFYANLGGQEKSEICMSATRISPSPFYRALKSLTNAGILEKCGVNKFITYRATNEGMEFAITTGLLPDDFHRSDHDSLPTLFNSLGLDSDGGDCGKNDEITNSAAKK